MHQFKITQEGLTDIRKKGLMRSLPILGIIMMMMIWMFTDNSDGRAMDLNIVLIVIPVLLIFIAFSGYKAINRQMVLLKSYTLFISETSLKREQFNTPPIEIIYPEVTEITKAIGGGFIVKGKRTEDIILIPQQIEQPIELEQLLNNIKTVNVKVTKSFLEKYALLSPIITIGLMITFYTVENKIVFGTSGILLVVLLLWGLYKIQVGKNYDRKTKRFSWVSLIVIASIITSLIYKIGA